MGSAGSHMETQLMPLRAQAGELVVAVPENGIDPSWLARPLAQLGLEDVAFYATVRVQPPASWRWGTADAAFLARLVAELQPAGQKLALQGLPPELDKLLALARGAAPSAHLSAKPPGIRARLGLAALGA